MQSGIMAYMKQLVQKAFSSPQTKTFHVVQDFLALLTIVSIVALVLETVPALSGYSQTFLIIEWVAVSIFTIEYASRLYVSKPAYKYSLSFFGVVDLVSILP